MTTPDLITRLRTRPTGDPYLHMMVHEAADELERMRTAFERLQQFDFECRRDGIEPLPPAVVQIIDTALAG